MKLSRAIAQKIVSEMMDVIPYNINVMDENGVIIGSGDRNRVGNIHEGAIKAIGNQAINEVYEEEGRMKLGVNEPIIINGEIIGVIGITGHPRDVRRFSKLVRVTAVLLIEQAKINEETQSLRLNRQKFYHELAHRKIEYDDEFYQRAKSYGMNLTKKIQAVLIKGNINSESFKKLFNKYSHYCEFDNSKAVFFTTNSISNSDLLKTIEKSEDINKISLGGENNIAAISLENAEMAMNVGMKIKPSKSIYSYGELKSFINLSCKDKSYVISLISNLDKAGNRLELIQTMQTYIEENGDISLVSNKLNIHRNTLNYRLERIKQLTGKNPKVLLDLFELLCGLIWR
ncbi:helix-turn-helix domain-containing protein [Clostridium sp. SHJSY1]|uniref:CdaR family transcriptional regulator n=1 Tax=Clostridium sp. SHJSY1 TaxID=2942483 RepID=UPI00287529E7|nr:sugar diacid recognition domain-containing protein [Clostridium sp. SHJSY1]MDS0525721.1 helix-turn-helix domain-containing protein [Clostridium sp. SHJSY1]